MLRALGARVRRVSRHHPATRGDLRAAMAIVTTETTTIFAATVSNAKNVEAMRTLTA
jgi:cysteine synthase